MARIPTGNCGVCSNPVWGSTGFCRRTKPCKAAYDRAHRKGEAGKNALPPVPCSMCGRQTRSRVGVCQASPECKRVAHALYMRKFREEDPEKYRQHMQRYAQAHRREIAERAYDYVVKASYGLTRREARDLRTGKPCAICGVSDRRMEVDHDHTLESLGPDCIRGILCGNCNKILGYANDNIELLKAAIGYLADWDNRKPASSVLAGVR